VELRVLVDPKFQSALRKLASQELPLRAAFTLKGIINSINGELKKYDEVRNEALQQLGEKDDGGKVATTETGSVKLSEQSRQLFMSEMTTLLATPVDVGSISIKDLGEKCLLSTADLLTLDELIKE
jgi:hypothetical protein